MIRFVTGRPRLFAALALGLVLYPLLPGALPMHTRLLCAWDAGVFAYLLATFILFYREPLTRVAADAERQQDGEWTIFGITVAVVLASFVSIFGEFSNSKSMHGAGKDLHVGLVGATLLLSWLMLHATFCLRYAHEFYSVSEPGGPFDQGLDFPKEEHPDYWDFAYFSLVLGMTFQVSDVEITSRKLRRLATVHGLLSFLFNTVIIALTVNIGASLL